MGEKTDRPDFSAIRGHEEWYKKISLEKGLPLKCRYANCGLCQRYLATWQAVSVFAEYRTEAPSQKEMETAQEYWGGLPSGAMAQAERPTVERRSRQIRLLVSMWNWRWICFWQSVPPRFKRASVQREGGVKAPPSLLLIC